jgi:hypothetical protein
MRHARLARLALCPLLLASLLPAADAVPTQLVHQASGWQLIHGGTPWQVRGAGGDASKTLLASLGGNTCRTWAADAIGDRLDDAHKAGLAVVVGIWLGHERHGFKWNDPAAVQKQFDMAKSQVLKWKDHPAVLAWGIGNEMEGFADGGNPDIWNGIEAIAKMVHEIDPAHPTMTTVAEIGGKRVQSINSLCPSIDIVGINSYGGSLSLAERYRKSGGTKPYLVTEYGPAGTWEVGKNSLGGVDEATSTAKAETYGKVWDALDHDKELCLGGLAFAWGSKVEATATWFGMVLPDGSRLGACDVLAARWGKPVANRSPEVKPLTFDVGDHPTLKPGAVINATMPVTDPENDALTGEWILAQESSNYNTGGDAQAMPPIFPEAIITQKVAAGASTAQLKLPEGGGMYRLYAYIRDGHGGAALSSALLKIDGPAVAPKPRKMAMPAPVAGGEGDPLWAASGFMGDTKAIAMDAGCSEQPKVGKTCLKVQFTQDKGWGGVVWQSPANDWGKLPGGYDLSAAKTLKFWARGEAGGESIKFGFGVIGNDQPFGDSGKLEKAVTMSTEWQEVAIDVSGRDLSRIKTGFMWVGAAKGKPFTFYLDDVRWE